MFEKETNWIISAFKLLFTAVIVIYAAYIVIKSLIPEVPVHIGVILLGILTIFVYAIRDKIKESLDIK